jgi:CheY-like chemotaxis protein
LGTIKDNMTKILLVEDDKSLREIYGVRLLAEGYDIVSAGDGEEALAMAIKERPELIVSDVMMPKISGFDMLDILRSTTETKNIKVIMMTALSSEDQRARGQALGADRYLVKSQVGIEDVVRTVHEVLADAPVAAPTPAQTFGTAAPSALPRTSVPNVPPRQPAPTYNAAPAPQPVAAPTPAQTFGTAAPSALPRTSVPNVPPRQPAPTYNAPTVPAPQPVAAPTPAQTFGTAAPQPAAAPSSTLPQPTAPFSTPRPANLGDRIIHPVPPTNLPTPDLGSLMEQELNSVQTPASSQPTPTAPPQPFVPAQPQPVTLQPVTQPTPPVQPSEMHGATAITFDEPGQTTAPAAPIVPPEDPQNPSDSAPRA